MHASSGESSGASFGSDMYATDRAVELAAAGVPFRTAYRQVAEESGLLESRTPEESLSARTSPGATGNLGLAALRARLAAG
jgi:argininosuccinate lyase